MRVMISTMLKNGKVLFVQDGIVGYYRECSLCKTSPDIRICVLSDVVHGSELYT